MQLDSGKSISLPDIQIYAAGLMVWHLLLNSTSSWIHMKRTSFFSSVADEVTASRGLYGKATDSFSSYYIVVVFIDPLQGLYAILFGDTVDWFASPTT